MTSRFLTPVPAALLALTALALGLAGCGSGPRPPRQAPGDALMAPREMPALYEGTAEFCNGSIRAVVTVSKGFGGMHAGRGGGGPGGRRGGPGGHGGRPSGDEVYDEQSPHRIGESSLPPVMIHLRFENSSDAPVVLSIWDFRSELGDFAVRPDRLTVPAKGSARVESMTSRVGFAQAELPVTLHLRSSLGDETRVVKVTLIPGAGPESAPAGK